MEKFLCECGYELHVCLGSFSYPSQRFFPLTKHLIGLYHNWIASLADNFTSHNFEVIDSFSLAHRNDLKKAFTDNWLTALKEAGDSFTSRGGGSGPFATAEDFRNLFRNVLRETREGTSITLKLSVILGRERFGKLD